MYKIPYYDQRKVFTSFQIFFYSYHVAVLLVGLPGKKIMFCGKFPIMQQFSKFSKMISSKAPENFTLVNYLLEISMQMNFSSYFLCLLYLKPLFATHFGHDSSYYFTDYRRNKHHKIIKQTVPERLDCQGKTDATNRIVD